MPSAPHGRTAAPQEPTAPPAGPRVHHRPGVVLAVIVGCQLMIGLDTSVVTVALPDVRAGLGLSTGGLAWVQNSYMLAFGGLLLLGGRAGDVFGRRRAFTAGVVLFTAASLLAGFADAGWWLLTARAAQGVAAAVAAPSAMSLIATNFEGQARARALSVFSAVTGAGAAVGMLVGGVLTEAASWRLVFFVNVPVGIVLALLAPRVLAETPRRPGRFDAAGAAAATAGMTALVYALIRVGSDGWGDGRALAAFGAAAVLLAGFVAIEHRTARPLMPLWLLTGRDRAASYLCQLLLVGANFGAFFFCTLYLQQVLGYGPLAAGAAFLPFVGLQFATVRAAPRLLQRFGARVLVVAGMACALAGLLWLTRLSAGDGYAAGVLGPFMLMGAGGGLSIMPLNATILGSVGPADSGAASGVAQTMLWAGGSLGSAVMVTVFGSGHAGTAALMHDMDAAFATGAGFAAAALLVAVAVLRVER
ncbi:MFS transporter [Actinomadura sp. LD22]|uniref:MFS transporter n=1 Tax=Actinomadura physcomitrii TaxID=2650748 RepID=A0A6I4M8A3_9ACTN|nr:MFS transporter [Actinomadura physcomitrii]MWA01902.1 MFS transporter [Actinomadura physcomitrii]